MKQTLETQLRNEPEVCPLCRWTVTKEGECIQGCDLRGYHKYQSMKSGEISTVNKNWHDRNCGLHKHE